MEEDDGRRRGDDSSRKNEINVQQLHSAGRASEVTLHYMPFLIDYEGEAPIQNYFVVESERVKQEEEGSMSTLSTSTSSSSSSASAAPGDDILRASFRGRLLRGKTLPLPSDYQGLVLQEATGRGADGEKQWHVSGQFSEWTYWNHDTRPYPSDQPQQWMGWLHLSQQVTEEEIAALSS
ncbi:Ribonuclease H1/H2 small subunit [Acanthamoeba castellanii str. Neff]|uniref:Ribonuclease H1/H2 small subunit n=1 Tax=Acanthamoeba castellanii (strain ATCC 30010 / Neff) TaxID=1257118 RepID=L8GEE5_ACACF|nr:Ribonuclease H1/H2 small subunit [Acanthamoeba castellanii str. Neff]ELR11397.1 Ribonuclease H1/H2 small subunit [Acanthamoeba castellanii str. Neff]